MQITVVCLVYFLSLRGLYFIYWFPIIFFYWKEEEHLENENGINQTFLVIWGKSNRYAKSLKQLHKHVQEFVCLVMVIENTMKL